MIEEESENKKFTEALMKTQGDLVSGLVYTHTRLNDNTKKVLESTSFLYALIELLDDKNIISIKELDERKRQVAKQLVRKFTESGMGLMYQDPEFDKYNFEHQAHVDCHSRLPICKAKCCKFPFALSRQDVDEGIVRWEFGRPYLIAHDDEGYCIHLDKRTYKCRVHENRPVPCRGFDCRNSDKWKVWQDYEKSIISPELDEQVQQSNEQAYGGR